jgi:hypothetical protein
MSTMQSRDLPDPTHHAQAPIAQAAYLRAWIAEIRANWQEAREEAESALDAWRASPGTTAYALYRAAADRADAAQDELADAIRGVARTPYAARNP